MFLSFTKNTAIGNTARNIARSSINSHTSLPFSRVTASRVGGKTPFRSLNTTPTAGTGSQTTLNTIEAIAALGGMVGIPLGICIAISEYAMYDNNTVQRLQEKPNSLNPNYVADECADRESLGSLNSEEFVGHRNTVNFDKNKTAFLQAFHPENMLEHTQTNEKTFVSLCKALLTKSPNLFHRSNLQLACMMVAKEINNTGESPTYILASQDMDDAMKYIQKLCHANSEHPIKFKFLINYGVHSGIIDFKIEKGRLSAVIIDSFGTENVAADHFEYSKYIAESLEYIARNAKELNIPCDIFIARNRIQGNSELCDLINVALIDELNKMAPDIHDYCRENSTRNTQNHYLVREENRQYNALVNAFDLPLSFISCTQSLKRMHTYFERASLTEKSQHIQAEIRDAQTFVEAHAMIEDGRNQKAKHEFGEFYQLWNKEIKTEKDLDRLYKKAEQYNGLRFQAEMANKYNIIFDGKKALKISNSFEHKGHLRNMTSITTSFCAGGTDYIHQKL